MASVLCNVEGSPVVEGGCGTIGGARAEDTGLEDVGVARGVANLLLILLRRKGYFNILTSCQSRT